MTAVVYVRKALSDNAINQNNDGFSKAQKHSMLKFECATFKSCIFDALKIALLTILKVWNMLCALFPSTLTHVHKHTTNNPLKCSDLLKLLWSQLA